MGIKGVFSDPLCKHCGEKDPEKFYQKMKTTCNKCHGLQIEKKRVQKRIDGIEYKGGKCERCGYNKYRGALEFHHKDPTQKDPLGLRAYNSERFLAEIDKCMLLCANCHREIHAGL